MERKLAIIGQLLFVLDKIKHKAYNIGMDTDNVRYLPVPRQLTPEQRQHWRDQAAYWGVKEEDSMTALEYAQRQRENALRMLGMIETERGLGDEPA